MVVPVDRASFKEYCLRRLGKPVLMMVSNGTVTHASMSLNY